MAALNQTADPALDAPWITAQARSLLAQRGHAWLLAGPAGLGQYELALALVRAWLCEQPTDQGACGQCPSCHGIDVRAHSDLFVLMPEVEMIALGWPLAEKAQDELDAKKRKPSREIRVDAMREALEFAQRTSARGRGKAVLVFPAERMNVYTANALLKTLEEPPGDTRFVLASQAAHLVLPTVRSRCQSHAMHWPEPQQALAWLLEQGVLAADAHIMLRAAGQRAQEALRFADLAVSWSALPKAVAEGNLGFFKDWSAAQLIDALQKLAHDLMMRQAGSAPRFFQPNDLPAGGNWQSLSHWCKSLAHSRRHEEHPFNTGLMHEDLLSQARMALNLRA